MKNTEYLKENVNPFLIPLLKELMSKKPENSFEFIKEWVDSKGLEIQNEKGNQGETEK